MCPRCNLTAISKCPNIIYIDRILQEIGHLRYRLKTARPPTPSLTRTFEYGFNSDVMKMWIDYWANEYNFTGRMEYLNQYPQYMTTIQGLDIHFVRVKPKVSRFILNNSALVLLRWPRIIWVLVMSLFRIQNIYVNDQYVFSNLSLYSVSPNFH